MMKTYWTKLGARMTVVRGNPGVGIMTSWGGRFTVSRNEAAKMLRDARKQGMMNRPVDKVPDRHYMRG